MRNTTVLLLFTGAVLAAVGGCADKPKNPFDDPEFRAAYIREHVRDRYDIADAAPTPEAAVENFLNALAGGDEAQIARYVLSEREFGEMYWPNLPERYTRLAGNGPSDAWDIENEYRKLALSRLLTQVGPDLRVLGTVKMRRPSEQFNALTAHFPDLIELRDAQGRKREVDSIQVIVEHAGQFKVARLGPAD